MGTAAMLYDLVVGPHKPDAWPVMAPGTLASACTNNCLGTIEGLWPQALDAATTILPPWNEALKLTLMETVPCPLAMLAPGGTVHT